MDNKSYMFTPYARNANVAWRQTKGNSYCLLEKNEHVDININYGEIDSF